MHTVSWTEQDGQLVEFHDTAVQQPSIHHGSSLPSDDVNTLHELAQCPVLLMTILNLQQEKSITTKYLKRIIVA